VYDRSINTILASFFQAVNKLAEIMNRKDFNKDSSKGKKVNVSELKKKEKECRKLQQELTQVGLRLIIIE
jgi:predicted HNH restriction endonuclease